MSKVMIQNISLRGTLAAEFYERSLEPGMTHRKLEQFVFNIIRSDSPNILKIQNDNSTLLIGKRSEVGMFPPDW
ncbi:hypothetical protein KI809_07840 [Geobacter pelophilus]|uniref:Uncharacterized protein n=1 Tax=Geoanaerobacter pelophilus TaxID=60036 RepID=A0AAW4L3T1_9BACT|nr:hypothetical protein [Geoanaerobacter pelophilus]MBT0664212.1 hypothetical protein [Geoanaerobacter pelophilus]